ncbi:MAG: DUF6011 domain-containing protein [Veillonellales bacterium]
MMLLTNVVINMRCKRCGRALKDSVSIEHGYGPVCYEKRYKGFKYQTELRFNPLLVGTAREQHDIIDKLLKEKI